MVVLLSLFRLSSLSVREDNINHLFGKRKQRFYVKADIFARESPLAEELLSQVFSKLKLVTVFNRGQ